MRENTQKHHVEDSLLTEQLEQEERETTAPELHPAYELNNERTAISEMVKGLQNAFIITLVISVGIMLTTPTGGLTLGFYIKPPMNEGLFHFIFATVAVIYGGIYLYLAAPQVVKRSTANTAILVLIAILAAYIYSIVTTFFMRGEHLYSMATLLLSIVLLGYWIEMIIWGRLNTSLQSFLNNKPRMVNLMTGKSPTVTPIEQINTGDILLVRPGERVPVDGVIIKGDGLIDESAINGNPYRTPKEVGDNVIGGSANHGGTFQMMVTRVGSDSALAQMVRLVEIAQGSSTPLQNKIKGLMPFLAFLVIAIGIVTFLVWYLALGQSSAFALVGAVAVMIASGLDMLTLSVLFAVAVGVGVGIRQGILVRDTGAFEKASSIDTVVFDKVSCLTKGNPQVTDIIHVGNLTEPGFLRLAASIEKTSKDVVAQAVVKEAEKQVGKAVPNPEKYEHIPGKGAKGELETRTIIIGNERLMVESEINISDVEERAERLTRQGKTVVYVAVDGNIEGVLGIADEVRPDAQEMVKKLQEAEIEVAMITGDDYRTATALASELNIDRVYADVLPGDRGKKIKEVQNQGLRVAVVGNGLDDVDALEQADISFAVTDGTNLDVKSGSIILARNNPLDVMGAIALSKLIAGKVKQNIAWTIGYNVLAIPIAAGVLYPPSQYLLRPELAAVAMSASVLIVMGNSLLLKRKAFK